MCDPVVAMGDHGRVVGSMPLVWQAAAAVLSPATLAGLLAQRTQLVTCDCHRLCAQALVLSWSATWVTGHHRVVPHRVNAWISDRGCAPRVRLSCPANYSHQACSRPTHLDPVARVARGSVHVLVWCFTMLDDVRVWEGSGIGRIKPRALLVHSAQAPRCGLVA